MRLRTHALVGALSRTQLEQPVCDFLSPLAWDLAHIAAYEDLWICHRHGGLELLHPELAQMYDAFETPREARSELPLLTASEALDYMTAVRERALEVVARSVPDDEVIAEMVLEHETQHCETMLQAVLLGRMAHPPGLIHVGPPMHVVGADPEAGLQRVAIPGGRFAMGAPTLAERFSYDNERPRHVREVADFWLGRTPVTNATFLAFAEGGGYERREWWSDEGWAWKEEYDITHPGGWSQDRRSEWRLDGWAPLDLGQPVVCISWFEADALARALGARLPTEVEWERAAAWDQETRTARSWPWGERPPSPREANVAGVGYGPHPTGSRPAGRAPSGCEQMIGEVWEWTASEFDGYPHFAPSPYREYSEVFFGRGYRVLRGGSWATSERVASATTRNWDHPHRRQLFAGVRLAWDAG